MVPMRQTTENSDWVAICSKPPIEEKIILTRKHKEILLNPTKPWLSTDHTEAATILLRNQFPEVDGLLGVIDRSPERISLFYRNRRFVEIVHVHGNHFVLFESYSVGDQHGKNPFVVNMHDSLASKMVSVGVPEMITATALANTNCSSMELRMKQCAQQDNFNDCGVYAIANAFAVCNGDDLTKCAYDIPRVSGTLNFQVTIY